MKYLTVAATILPLVPGLLALTINTPASVVACQPQLLSWSDGVAPYYVSVIPGGQASAAPLKQFPTQNGNTLTWVVDIPPNTRITVALKDSTGQVAFTDAVMVQGSPDSSCLSGGGGGGGGSAPAPQAPSNDATTGGASPAAPAGGASAAGSPPGAPSSGSSPGGSSGSPPSSPSNGGGTTPQQPAPAAPTTRAAANGGGATNVTPATAAATSSATRPPATAGATAIQVPAGSFVVAVVIGLAGAVVL